MASTVDPLFPPPTSKAITAGLTLAVFFAAVAYVAGLIYLYRYSKRWQNKGGNFSQPNFQTGVMGMYDNGHEQSKSDLLLIFSVLCDVGVVQPIRGMSQSDHLIPSSSCSRPRRPPLVYGYWPSTATQDASPMLGQEMACAWHCMSTTCAFDGMRYTYVSYHRLGFLPAGR